MRYKKVKADCASLGIDMSFSKFNFVIYYEEFQEHFTADTDDHYYDDVYRIVRKTVEYLEKSVEKKTGSGKLNKRTAEQ
jgi:hypothetical protein